MTQTQTPYRVKGVFLETCNCDSGCNCNFGGFPDHGSCEALVGRSEEHTSELQSRTNLVCRLLLEKKKKKQKPKCPTDNRQTLLQY